MLVEDISALTIFYVLTFRAQYIFSYVETMWVLWLMSYEKVSHVSLLSQSIKSLDAIAERSMPFP